MEPALSSDHPAGHQSQYLTFVVGDAEYGIGLLRAKEIIEYDTVTTVPNAPAFVRTVAEAALIACLPDYELLRPVLLELKRRYPEGVPSRPR